MRITAAAKDETRGRILDAARKLFAKNGFESSTTRDIAAAAKIATGTLFNYFPNKEAIAMTFIAESLTEANADFTKRRRDDESLEEDLFAHIAAGLRRLTPHRHYVGSVLETAMSPFTRTPASEQADSVRVEHLETVTALLQEHGQNELPSPLTIHLYWTLYLGVLGFWASDASPKQEDTLAVLDQSMRLFVSSLSANSST